ASTVISSDGMVMVNGQQWDNWPGASGFVREQIRWLLSCKADLDGDGELTIFDFLEFQRLFDARDVRADVFYDGKFDVFDFLAFFNQFDAGC
ncbi:MAG: GC-type dockerin domain-anchored protein, partial [Phycisphaerales bacterium JB060]